MTSEMKPCPFCGSEAEVVKSDYGMYLTGYAVYCRKCCTKMGVTGRLCEAYEWTPVFDTEAEAIDAWNARAERTCSDLGGCDEAGMQVFNCSECGCVLSLFDVSGISTLCTNHIYDYPRYCPNCGAKVVEG